MKTCCCYVSDSCQFIKKNESRTEVNKFFNGVVGYIRCSGVNGHNLVRLFFFLKKRTSKKEMRGEIFISKEKKE